MPGRAPGSLSGAGLSGTIKRDGHRDLREDIITPTVGVSGALRGERDEACSQAGLDKVADQLK